MARMDRGSRITTLAALATVLALGAVTLACGGGGDGAATATAAAGRATPAGTATAAPAAATPGAALTAFRYRMSVGLTGSLAGEALGGISGMGGTGGSGMGGTGAASSAMTLSIKVEGAVVAPDREQSRVTANLGLLSLDIETVRVGDRNWSRQGGGAWSADAPGTDAGALGLSLSPEQAFGSGGLGSLRAALAPLRGAPETVDGVAALRYDLSAEQFSKLLAGGLFGGLGDTAPAQDARTTIWVTADARAFPVRLSVESPGTAAPGDGAGSGKVTVEMSFSDFNSPSITITPPL